MALWDEKRDEILAEACRLVRAGEVKSLNMLDDAFLTIASDALGLPRAVVEVALSELSGAAKAQLRAALTKIWADCQKQIDVDGLVKTVCALVQIRKLSGNPMSNVEAVQFFVDAYKRQTGIDIVAQATPITNNAISDVQACVIAASNGADINWDGNQASKFPWGKVLGFTAAAYAGYRILR